jgi:hypothetical protein
MGAEAVVTSWAVPSLRKGSLVKFTHTGKVMPSYAIFYFYVRRAVPDKLGMLAQSEKRQDALNESHD